MRIRNRVFSFTAVGKSPTLWKLQCSHCSSQTPGRATPYLIGNEDDPVNPNPVSPVHGGPYGFTILDAIRCRSHIVQAMDPAGSKSGRCCVSPRRFINHSMNEQSMSP